MYRKTGKSVYKTLMDTIGDIHKVNCVAFNMAPSAAEVNKDQRDQVKSIVFGCFTGDTIVSTQDGPIRIGKLHSDKTKPKVLTRGAAFFKSEGAKSQGVKPVVGVLTRHAYLKGTASHHVLVVTKNLHTEMVPLSKLSAGDLVVYQRGHLGTGCPRLDGQELSINDAEALGMLARNSRVPSVLLSAATPYIQAYLRGYFEVAGGVRHIEAHPQVFASTCNVDLATDVCYLLNALCIHAKIYRVNVRVAKTGNRSIVSKEEVEIVISHADSVRLFLETIGFITVAKKKVANDAFLRIFSCQVQKAEPLDISKTVDYPALRALYAERSGVTAFRGPNPVVIKGVTIPPLPSMLGDLIASIHYWHDAFYVLGLNREWDTLHMVSGQGCTVSRVVETAICLGDEEVFDVVNVHEDHTWSANGVVVSNSIYGRSANAISKQVKKAADLIKKLMKKFFDRFKKAAAYLDSSKQKAVSKGYTVSPLGRVRHLFAHYFGRDDMIAAVERRGANAPIQGIAADLGHTAAYLYELHLSRFIHTFEKSDGYLKSGTTSFVHDAIKSVVEYKYLIPALQILQWCSTIGVCEYYTRHFGMKFYVEPEIDIEIGPFDSDMEKWDWHESTLREILHKALEKQASLYEINVEETEMLIWNQPPKVREYLDKHYPFFAEWPDAIHLRKGTAQYNEVQKALKEVQNA